MCAYKSIGATHAPHSSFGNCLSRTSFFLFTCVCVCVSESMPQQEDWRGMKRQIGALRCGVVCAGTERGSRRQKGSLDPEEATDMPGSGKSIRPKHSPSLHSNPALSPQTHKNMHVYTHTHNKLSISLKIHKTQSYSHALT